MERIFIMIKVKKSDYWKSTHSPEAEPYEAFNACKIEMALIRAGARGPEVKEIAAMVKPFKGITTEDIDKIVVEALERRDPDTAKYWKMMTNYKRSRFKR